MPLRTSVRTVVDMAQQMNPTSFDCVVIGGGPAGLAAALVLGRSRRRTIVVDAGRPANRTVAHSHGFLSRDGISPSELAAIGREQLVPYGVEVVDGIVTSVRRGGAGFVIDLGDGRVVEAQRVIVASGVYYDLPVIDGLAGAWGKGAAGCPYCHAWEVRDRPLGVLAVDAEHAARLAVMLLQWTADVTLYTQGADVDLTDVVARGISVDHRNVVAVHHVDGDIGSLRLDDGSDVACGGLFVAAPPRFDATLVRALGVSVDAASGWPVAEPMGKTAVPGVWVAGTAANPMLTLLESAASGARAAMMLNAEWSLGV